MNVRKFSLLLVMAALLMLALVACNSGGAAEVTPTEAPAMEPTMAAEEPTMAAEEPAGEAPAAGELGSAEKPIIMSFVPSGDTQDILASGDTLAQMLTERTGLNVEATVGTDFSSVREAMCAGQAHIGWLNTFNYVMAAEQCGVDAALVTSRFGTTTYAGQIIVRADSGIKTLQDLKGKVMCWVDPASTSGYIIPRIMLAAEGVDPDKDFSQTIEAGSHNNVVTQVYNGDCDAGATFSDARTGIEEEFPDVLEKVVVLANTSDIPNDSVAFIADFPAAMRDQIVNALLDISGTPEGQEALNTLYNIEGLQASSDAFYDTFRADLSRAGINIEELAQ